MMLSSGVTINTKQHHQETVMDTAGSPDLDQWNDANRCILTALCSQVQIVSLITPICTV